MPTNTKHLHSGSLSRGSLSNITRRMVYRHSPITSDDKYLSESDLSGDHAIDASARSPNR